MQLLSTLVFVGVAYASVSRVAGRSSPATEEPSTSLASSTDASPSTSISESIPLELDGTVKIVASIRVETDDTLDQRLGFPVQRDTPKIDEIMSKARPDWDEIMSKAKPDPILISTTTDSTTALISTTTTFIPTTMKLIPTTTGSSPTTPDPNPTTTDSADGGSAYLFGRKRSKQASPEDAGGLYEKPQLHSDCIPRNSPEAEDPMIYEMQGSIPQPPEMAINEAPARELPSENTT
ncbi:hypothetical protein ACJZ2D_016861 [Fusarium nematophilum]